MVFFLCLWFALLLFAPDLWWLGVLLCSLGFVDARKRIRSAMPEHGNIQIQEGETWLLISDTTLVVQGEVASARRYASWLVISVKTDSGTKRVAFLASAMDEASWSHFNRIVLASH
ncbi:hypothetical protein JL49_10885 [Pseudoalteromonas luteoviolacea]|nr:hypothetical protein JL49_10885 [Pseudoalteromonas luteoviolacea]